MCPVYVHSCQECGQEQDEFYSMKETPRILCNQCGEKTTRIITSAPALMFGGDHRWSDMNGGRGEYITQLAEKPGDPKAYCRSHEELTTKAQKAGFTKIEKTG